MTPDEQQFLKEFYQALADRPLDPEEHWYQPFYKLAAQHPDPVEDLLKGIEWAETLETAQLFSGFRGTGKSTELRRLQQRLAQNGQYKVLRCDMQEYLNLSTPIDISDFLIAIAGAFSEKLAEDDFLGDDPSHENYWDRISNFLTKTKINFESVFLQIPGVDIKANLKQDPSFKSKLQQEMKGHLGALANDVRLYLESCIKKLRNKHGDDTQVVLLLDSIEQIRGTSVNEDDVYASVETVFQGHADKLRLPYIHVVYTVPPWLKIRSPGVAALYSNSEHLPCIKVRQPDGAPDQTGVAALVELVGKRGDWQKLFGSKENLERVILASGGYLRDLLRLLQRCLRQASSLPIDKTTIEMAEHHIRNSYLPISRDDAVWLNRVATTHRAELMAGSDLGHLSRFFDTHLILCYRNGKEWFDVHPLIAEHVRELAQFEAE
ncbi:MAG: hypothetical protein JXR76_08365 [Deltaproteobacteria bacterium]|nr:hypothetical protein [Deltaproteobacteria bacterium]